MPARPHIRSSLTAVALVVAAVVASGCSGGVPGRGGDAPTPTVASLRGTDQAAAARANERLAAKASAARTTAGAGGKSTEAALLRFTACLRDNGLDVPDPKVDAKGNVQLLFDQRQRFDPNDPKVKRAQDRCRKYLTAIVQSFSPQDISDIRDALVAYAACVRKHGYDLPDPNFLSRQGPFGKLDPGDPRFQRASKPCVGTLARIQEVLS